jgi:hypothetical protein
MHLLLDLGLRFDDGIRDLFDEQIIDRDAYGHKGPDFYCVHVKHGFLLPSLWLCGHDL